MSRLRSYPLRNFTFALLALLAGWTVPSNGAAQTYVWEMNATEDQVNNSGMGDGSTDSAATGHATIAYDHTTGSISFTIDWAGLEGLLTAIHLHGPATASESVMPHLWNVFDDAQDVISSGVNRTGDSYSDTVLLTSVVPGTPQLVAPIHLQHMVDEQGYVNIHSDLWPKGEIRANLVLVSENVPVTNDHTKCIQKMQKQMEKISRAVERRVSGCVRFLSRSPGTDTYENCIATEDPKTTSAVGAATNVFDGVCSGFDGVGYLRFPAFGTAQVDEIQAAAEQRDADFAHGIFGPDLDMSLITELVDRDASRCQQLVLRKAQICEASILQEYRKCSTKGFKGTEGPAGTDLPFDDPTDQAACLGHDPDGKLSKKCDTLAGKKVDPIRKAIAKQCVDDGVDLLTAFPGCETSDGEALHACILASARCATCKSIRTASEDFPDGCDEFDDGSTNASCD